MCEILCTSCNNSWAMTPILNSLAAVAEATLSSACLFIVLVVVIPGIYELGGTAPITLHVSITSVTVVYDSIKSKDCVY